MDLFKLTNTFQKKWINNQFFDKESINKIDPNVQLHKELNNVLSSAASCINLFSNLNKTELQNFLNRFDLQIQEIIPFPTASNIGGEVYNDEGYVIFEWIGPKRSTLNEVGGKRGQNRTSIDAFVLAKINGKITQILIEWKFTESYNSEDKLQKFFGIAGTERLRRYSNVLAKLRKNKEFPFKMKYESDWGISDLGYEPFYQLLRMILLAKSTTPFQITDKIFIEDYRILHLTHSENTKLNIVTKNQLRYCPGIKFMAGSTLHQIWKNLLTENDSSRFKFGYWNKNLDVIKNTMLKNYLLARYE